MFRYPYPLVLMVSVFGFLACERSDLSPADVEPLLASPESSARVPTDTGSVLAAPSATVLRASPTGLNLNWVGRWRAGLTAYTEIAGRSFEGPIHGRDIQLDVKEDGRFLFWVQEYSHNAPGDVSSCAIEARINAEGSGLVMREEKSTCVGKQLLPRDHTARIYLVSPCILKIETSPGVAGMNGFALTRAGCAKSEKAYPHPGL